VAARATTGRCAPPASSASRRGGTGAVFTPLKRIGYTVSRWQDVTPTVSGPEFQNPNIEIRNSFKGTETDTSLFALIRQRPKRLLRNLRESAESADNIIGCRR
jgi:hypothetical protein